MSTIPIASFTNDLPPMPQVAWEILKLPADEAHSAAALETTISRDQALAARMLRIANSAMFGLRSEVTSLHRAIVLLGWRTVRSVAVAASSESLFSSKSASLKDNLLWKHAVATSLVARMLSRRRKRVPPDEAFLAGLMHDIGKVVIDRSMADRYLLVVQRVYNDGLRFLDAEQEILGFDHAQVGHLVASHWGFAPELCDAIGFHHNPRRAQSAPELAAVVSLANAICVKIGIGPELQPELELTQLDATRMLSMESEVPDLFEETRELVETGLPF